MSNWFLEEGVAKGEDALSILDNPKTRTKFIDDLMEVYTVYIEIFAVY